MVQIYIGGGNQGLKHVEDNAAPLGELVTEQRVYWCEDAPCQGEDCPGLVVVFMSEGVPLATLVRDQCDPEICHTMWCDGSVEHHRCHYVTDSEGSYERTEVTEVQDWNGRALLHR